MFPIRDRHVFEGIDALAHSGYFADALTREKIQAWLTL